MSKSKVGLLLHADRAAVSELAANLTTALNALDVELVLVSEKLQTQVELLVVLGGDGTILRAAEIVHGTGTPILGVNLGRVGFLAEAEPADIATIATAIAEKSWLPEQRISLRLKISRGGKQEWESFALNEIAIEKTDRVMMTELKVDLDGAPVTAWSGDGLIVSTPTGSTAYAFSAGGPVIWPTADVIEVVPISAHALFARALVVSPETEVAVEVLDGPAVATCDGRRLFELETGDVLKIVKGSEVVTFARIHPTPFTSRLVSKFQLPTQGWRTQRDLDA